jgi:hypothetical protein
VTDVRRRYGIYKVTEVFLTTRWVSPQSPRLALRLPWKKRRSVTNHNRGCAKITQRPQKTHLNWRNPFRVDLMFDDWPQGSSFVATLGFEAQPLRGKIRKRSATKVYNASLRHKLRRWRFHVPASRTCTSPIQDTIFGTSAILINSRLILMPLPRYQTSSGINHREQIPSLS